ncbi:alpha/beta hydrolase [Rugamonas sp.]|uniref:alpha/beta fold hydrolase n=1 Tax=Rugamonas sp. TaxID=1926287 RepID=UPI0025E6D1F0|nr:alpha/beta hydrolase [Rugamonas sp.]
MQRSLISILFFASSLLSAQTPAQAAATHPAFHVDVTGDGAAIILIPGLSSPGAVWDGTVQHLCVQQHHQCHVLSLAGFAGTAPIAEPLLPAVEQQLSDYIADHGLDHPTVIGHSMGGFLGMKLAADHPQQVGRLIIVDTLPALGAMQRPTITREQLLQAGAVMRDQMLKSSDAQGRAYLARVIRTMVSKPADVDRVAGWGAASDRSTVATSMYQMMTDDLRQDVARIEAPTLVLGTWIGYKDYGSKDQFEGTFKSQYQKLPGVTIEMSDTARHFIMYDDADWLYARIDQFLK